MIPIGKDRPARRVPVMTWLLVLGNLAAFVYQMALGDAVVPFIRTWGLIPARLWEVAGTDPGPYLRAAWLPLLTCMFLHGGWLHLLGNLVTLRVFGDRIEERLGHLRFLLFYLLCGLLASALHIASGPFSEIPTIGASGAIAGVMGAYLLLFPFEWVRFVIPIFFIPFVVRLPAFLYLLFWVATQALGGYQTLAEGTPAAGGIAFWAHLGGFFAGVFWIRRWRIRRAR